jgi:DNA-binding NtrC family response regulator
VVGMTGQSKHNLVIGDDGDVRGVIVDTLQEQHFRVSTTSSGSTMRDFLNTGDTVDCIILDALIPGEASASLALSEGETNPRCRDFREPIGCEVC